MSFCKVLWDCATQHEIYEQTDWLNVEASWKLLSERRGSVVVSTPAWHAGDLGSIPGPGMLYFRCNNLALNIIDYVSLCLSEETLKSVGPFYLVSMPGEVKYPTQGVNV